MVLFLILRFLHNFWLNRLLCHMSLNRFLNLCFIRSNRLICLYLFYWLFINNRLIFFFGFQNLINLILTLLLANGSSSYRFRVLFSRSNRRFSDRLIKLIEIYFSDWFILRTITLKQSLCPMISSRLLLFRLLLEKFSSVILNLFIVFKGSDKSIILPITEFEVQVTLNLSQLLFLLQELHCRLKSYIQFSNCFV